MGIARHGGNRDAGLRTNPNYDDPFVIAKSSPARKNA